MTRIAVISDIHANYEAIKAVAEDIKKQNVDKVICLGDIVGKGINAHKAVEIVREISDVCIMGNLEERTCANPEDFKDDKIEFSRITYNKTLVTEDDIEFMKNLPQCYEMWLSGNFVRFFHSNPNSYFIPIHPYETDFKEKFKMFEGGRYTVSDKLADMVVCGHFHFQYMEKIFNRTIVNVGSVGSPGCLISDEKYNAEPREIVQAHYAILEGEIDSKEKGNIGVTFRSVDYDVEKELKSGEFNPEFEGYANELRFAKYRYIDKEKEKLEKMGYKF